MSQRSQDRFIALPVACGDAFYLQRSGMSFLIDGGKSTQALPGLFREYTSSKGVDVLVCTHNDADHANGVAGFLDSELTCGEVWLPGEWLNVLPRLLRPLEEVIEMIAVDVMRKNDEGGVEEPGPEGETDANGWPSSVAFLLEEASEWPTRVTVPFWPYTLRHVLHLSTWADVESAIEAGDRIRKIAIAAFQKNIPVRWFQHDSANPGGGNKYLTPLSAKAQTRVVPVVMRFLEHLRLTTVNKESLVFCSPGNEHAPAVLFCADSDLDGVSVSGLCLTDALATAPHHGAEANTGVYSKVDPNMSMAVTWVRSDSRSSRRPCSGFKAQTSRYCTLCSGAAGRHQPLKFTASAEGWQPSPNTTGCVCK